MSPPFAMSSSRERRQPDVLISVQMRDAMRGVGRQDVNFCVATEPKRFRQSTPASGRFAPLGRRWDSAKASAHSRRKPIKRIPFPEIVTSLRNAGATGSNPIGGIST